MAARIFPNTVYVEGIPGQASRFEILRMFGGNKGHIKDVQFTSTPGEPKKAFVVYSEADSIPLALRMTGTSVYNNSEPLRVRQVDEEILCHHVPGEMRDALEALELLQEVLGHVMEKRHKEIDQFGQHAEAAVQRMAELRSITMSYKTVSEKTEQDMKAQLEAAQGRTTQAEAQCGAMRISLTETEARYKTSQELVQSQEGEIRDLKFSLDQACSQKESTMERLGIANNKVAALEEALKAAKEDRFEARSNLWRTETSLDDVKARLKLAETRADNADKKRARTEEWLSDEREAKRRAVLDCRDLEAQYKAAAEEVESGYMEKLDTVKAKFEQELRRRQDVEEQLAEANSKLDKTIVTDALLKAFVKMDGWVVRILGDDEESLSSPIKTEN